MEIQSFHDANVESLQGRDSRSRLIEDRPGFERVEPFARWVLVVMAGATFAIGLRQMLIGS